MNSKKTIKWLFSSIPATAVGIVIVVYSSKGIGTAIVATILSFVLLWRVYNLISHDVGNIIGWKQRVFRTIAILLGVVAGALCALFSGLVCSKGMNAPIDNIPEWAKIPIGIIIFVSAAFAGFFVVWTPYWVVINLFEKVSKNDQSE